MVGDADAMHRSEYKANTLRDGVFHAGTNTRTNNRIKLPSLSTSSIKADNLNCLKATPLDEVCMKTKTGYRSLMPKRDDLRSGLNYIRSPDSGLQDIMEDDAIFIDNDGEMCISVAKTPPTATENTVDDDDNDDAAAADDGETDDCGDVVENSDEGKATPPTPNDKSKRRVRFSLPGMGGRFIYPARVEEDRKRYRRYSSPSLFGENGPPDNRNGDGAEKPEPTTRRRKTSLPPITNFTVETFYESQVQAVDNLTNSLLTKESGRTTPREDSPTKMTSMASAHFQAVLNTPFEHDDDDGDGGNRTDRETQASAQPKSPSPEVDASSASLPPPSPASSSEKPRPTTPRRRKIGVFQGGPPHLDLKQVTSEVSTPRGDPLKGQLGPVPSSAETSGQSSPEVRSPRSSVSTPPTSKPPTPRLLKRRAISLGQTAKPDLAALQHGLRSPSLSNESIKNSVIREHEIKNLEKKLKGFEIRKKEIKNHRDNNYVSETISPIPDRHRQFRVRRKSLPSTMPPSPILIAPEIDFASLENCRYLRRKPSEDDECY